MYLYNTTFAVDKGLEKEVVDWLVRDFIPTAVSPNCGEAPELESYFLNNLNHRPQILEVLGSEPGITSLALHLYAESIRDIENWYADYGSELFSYIMERWGEKVLCFSTTLQLKYEC